MQTTETFVGIDLGTTFSAVACMRQNGPSQIIKNSEGERLTPSAILFDGDDIIVGSLASMNAEAYPGQVAQYFKRYMGEKDYYFSYKKHRYSAVELSSVLLGKIKNDIEQYLGGQPRTTVITVPAYFGDPQRRATLEAAERAGLLVDQLLNEPTAAAYSFGIHRLGSRKCVLVFDLGGGTFDVSIIEINGDVIEVLATGGDHQLGGIDWDKELMDHFAGEFYHKYGVNLLQEEYTTQALREQVVKAKIALSSLSKVHLSLQAKGHVLDSVLTREQFERITDFLVKRCQMLTEMVLAERELKRKKINQVLLVGSSTRMPMIPKMLQEFFGFPPDAVLNPDECVAVGASIKAALLNAKKDRTWLSHSHDNGNQLCKITDRNVTSHSLGFVVYKDGSLHNSIVIPKNTLYPCERSRSDYTTTYQNQPTLEVILTEGEDMDPYNCSLIGRYEAYDLPPVPAGGLKLSFTFRYNLNQLIEVEAYDLTGKRPLPVRQLAGEPDLASLYPMPVNVALLIDCSGSMRGQPIEEAKRATLKFINSFNYPLGRVALVGFPGGILHNLETCDGYLPDTINSIRASGGTPMTEALNVTVDRVLYGSDAEKVIILLTDGEPNDPLTAAEAAKRAIANGIKIITVGVSGAHKCFLSSIASSPEDFHWVDEPFMLTTTFANIASELSAGLAVRKR